MARSRRAASTASRNRPMNTTMAVGCGPPPTRASSRSISTTRPAIRPGLIAGLVVEIERDDALVGGGPHPTAIVVFIGLLRDAVDAARRDLAIDVVDSVLHVVQRPD